jgi:hypothetical protein
MTHFYNLVPRSGLRKTPFVADAWDLREFRPENSCEHGLVWNCFDVGKPIKDWPEGVTFISSSEATDGTLDDFVVNNAMAPLVTTQLLDLLKHFRVPRFQTLSAEAVWSTGKRQRVYVLNFIELISGIDVEGSRIPNVPTEFSNITPDGAITSLLPRYTTLVRANVEQWDLFRCVEAPSYLYSSQHFKRLFQTKKMTGVTFGQVKLR